MYQVGHYLHSYVSLGIWICMPLINCVLLAGIYRKFMKLCFER